MDSQLALLDKALVATLARTGIRPCVRMDTQMQGSVVAAAKALAAAFIRTGKRPDIGMRLEMLCQIGSLAKALATVRVSAGEGTLPVVHPLMGDQVTPMFKYPAAVIIQADKGVCAIGHDRLAGCGAVASALAVIRVLLFFSGLWRPVSGGQGDRGSALLHRFLSGAAIACLSGFSSYLTALQAGCCAGSDNNAARSRAL